MAVSKVILNSTTLMDATTATAAAADITAPKTAMLADGVMTTGTGSGGGGGNEKALVEGTLTSYTSSEVTALKANLFHDDNKIEAISCPNVTAVGGSAFTGARNLKTISVPNAVTIGAADNCKSLFRMSLPNVEGQLPGGLFRYDSNFIAADLGPGVTKLNTEVFAGTTVLSEMVLRRTSDIVQMPSINNVSATHRTLVQEKVGYVYVPNALMADYKTASNWSTLYASNANVFRKLEDYTVGGTTTGAIDYSKIWTAHTPVYSIANEYFDKTRLVDTGVSLFDSNFTIIFDLEGETGAVSSATVFSCLDNSGYGLKTHNNANSVYSRYVIVKTPNANSSNQYTCGKPRQLGYMIFNNGYFKTAIFDTEGRAGTGTNILAFYNDDAPNLHSEHLLLGGYNNAGTPTAQWKGTIYSLKVYKDALNINEIVSVLDIDH